MAKVVDIEEDHAQGRFHTLHAVRLAEEHGQDGFAVVDAREAVGLRIEESGFAEGFYFVRF
jgi:hypothetical protein